MGISGLLPLLKSIQKPCNLRSFAGQAIGVDAYGWLHRGTVSCAIDLALGNPTTKHIDFCMHRVRMLLHFGIKPYLVFDGDHLPGKEGTNQERAARRKENMKEGKELMKLGKTSQAYTCLKKAVDVTPEMARSLIEELKQLKVDYVVAPYEADSQMVYLERKGIIQGIVSEDSDLLVFGAKCLITKLDQYGECIVINRDDFTKCREISLTGWSDAQFRQMAILSGCDYLANISKMGLKTAYLLLRKHKTFDRVLRAIQFDGQYSVPPGYADSFYQAEMTFLYQWVYCPLTERLVHFTEPEPDLDISTLLYIGHHFEPKIAAGVARGDLHPNTKLPIEFQQQQQQPLVPPRKSIGLSRKSVIETPDLKKSKTIESFFKSRRQPLAELDPNLFTPSPSQRQALQQNRGSWSASPAPARPALPRSSTLSASITPHRTVSEPHDRRQSAPHPSKRQRLCSDSLALADASGSARVESGTSRFFASSTMTEPSPSTRSKKASKTDFDLWSDDSLEEAMAEMPDPSVTEDVTKKSKNSIFGETESCADSQSTDGSQSIFSQRSGKVTPATSCSQASSFGDPLPDEIKELRAKFMYQPTSLEPSRPALKRTGSGKAKSSLSRTVSAPLLAAAKPGYFSLGRYAAERSINSSTHPTQTTSRKTAGLPPSFGRKNEELHSSSASSSFTSQTPPPPSATESVTEVANSQSDIKDSAWEAMEAEVVVAAIAESPVKQAGVTGAGKGSEDLLLVPDSASEGEEENDDGLDAVRRKLDLGRFRLGAV
ncbi:uncharacterized protein K452DRAFT_245646 [Aplosporella prunicola CBS 121167]|uniref:Uncharacterized protein n=1 Tax=Aplosporella prunicola CBS 121167 TaxID=1176127 RepID=A0A6A6BPZ1_9PEZI|nr:uncharacterized protein K452DRAFT_245646 [Aplosporella prunicola CBS 121167]KAF2144641.1 hypothetical protein K452DRAFT_245646 [Aplosporella prunicola CBS 121167]